VNRRDFLSYMAAAGVFTGLGSRFPNVQAATVGIPRVLVNVMLVGGADLRFLFAPDPTKEVSYAKHFATARNVLYPSDTNPEPSQRVSNYEHAWSASNPYYLRPNDSTANFGIHKNATWLLDQYNKGNVAIISNVAASENRRHDHSQLIVNSGDLSAKFIDEDRDGWGGRLVESINAANVVAVTNDVSVFCNGSASVQNRNDKIIHMKNARKASLVTGLEANSAGYVDPNRREIGTALSSYYSLKRQQVAQENEDWIYHKFLRHEQKSRQFSALLQARLDLVAPEVPLAIRELVGTKLSSDLNFDTTRRLRNLYFGQQCATLYDSLAAADILNTRLVSMEYPGWDTHTGQRGRMEIGISDLFGNGKALDTLTQSLSDITEPWIDTSDQITNNIVYMITTDFGRQLKANGSQGTDHGRGNYVILIGNNIRGRVYGEIFPKTEIDDLGNGSNLFDKQGADIQGLTSIERILAAACDWVHPGSGANVIPNSTKNNLNIYPDGPALEEGVDLSGLFFGAPV